MVRFYNFGPRITFWTEQARSLITSAEYLKKPSLLGQEYFRQDSNAHTLYSGAYFNYLLVPIILISNYDPVIITAFFAILNIFTGFLVYTLVKKNFGFKLAVISATLFLFNDYMIYHSLFVWNYNLLPLVGLLVCYFLYKKKIFWSGLFSGLGISLQYLFAPIAAIIFIINIVRSKKKLVDSIIFVCGLILGNLPLVIFDIRHNFYNTITLLQYFLDTAKGKSDATFNYYYFLPFWPIFAIAVAWLVVKVGNKLKYPNILLTMFLGVYIYFNLISPKINFSAPTGMPAGLNFYDLKTASAAISKNANGDFNIAETLDFDKRAYMMRYLLQYEDDVTPQGVTEYPNAKTLYVLSITGYNFAKSNVWEIDSGGPYKISKLTNIGSGYSVYKLTK